MTYTNPNPLKRRRNTIFTPQRTVSGWDANRMNYRKMRGRNIQCTDTSIDLSDYTITGYICGDAVCECADLSWDHFDWASPIGTSVNLIKRKEFTVFIGTRDEVKTTLLTVKK